MAHSLPQRLSIGVEGLDEVLFGGLIPGRAYLVTGGPGCGKTTLGLHFLSADTHTETQNLFITLAQSESRLRKDAEGIGIDLSKIAFLDLGPESEFFTKTQTYDLFSPSEVEQEPMTHQIIEQVLKLNPTRVFLDPMTQVRELAGDVYQFRKMALSFLRFLSEQNITLMLTSELGANTSDDDLRFMSDGIIELDLRDGERTVRVAKFRGSDFRQGKHAMRLRNTGMKVFPKAVQDGQSVNFAIESLPSGVETLDDMLHGGIERSTVTCISGPSGTGKTTLGMQFVKTAADRKEHAIVYTFEESVASILYRCKSVNIPLDATVENGTLQINPIEPLQYSPDEFADLVRRQVKRSNARIVMLDSTAGYRLCFKNKDIVGHLHSLCNFLKNMGITVILITEEDAFTGAYPTAEGNIGYLADNIVFTRYIEYNGHICKAIGVLKKRLSDYEKDLRELKISREGISVEDSFSDLRSILSETPDAVGAIGGSN